MAIMMRGRVLLGLSMVAGMVGGALAGFLLAGTPVVAQEGAGPERKIVSAEEFRLVDKAGAVRALLSFSADGEPYLQFTDQKGADRIWLGIATESGLAVRDVTMKTRVLLSLGPDGDPSLVLRNRQHKARLFTPE
jgi:hypothetical protein